MCVFTVQKGYSRALCLRIAHAKLALSNPRACAHCWQRSTLERRVTFVERVLGGAVASHGPHLSFKADPEAALAVLGEAAGSWGDRMEAEDGGGIPLNAPEFTPNMIVKRFVCTAIHNKALYKCIIHYVGSLGVGTMTGLRWMRVKSSLTMLFRQKKSWLLPCSQEVARQGTIRC